MAHLNELASQIDRLSEDSKRKDAPYHSGKCDWIKVKYPHMPRLTFIRPLSPSAAVPPPQGDDWLDEPKWDGFRFQIIKEGNHVRLYSRHGAEYTDRLRGMAAAFAKLPTISAILDGELVLIDPRGAAHFYRLMAQMRTSHPDESPRRSRV